MKETSDTKIKYYAGVDLGGTFIKCGVVDNIGNLLIKDKIPTPKSYGETVSAMSDFALSLAEKAGVCISGIGIATPGMIDRKKGKVVFSGNLGWKNVYLACDMEKTSGVPTMIGNDANLAALGEYAFGAGKDYSSMVMITLGTGLGGGIVFDGELFEGNKGAGAEPGHMVIKEGGAPCTCGRRGCFEAYCSASALVKSAQDYMAEHSDTLLWELTGRDVSALDGKMFFAAVKQNDRGAKIVYNRYLRYLASGLASLSAMFRPEVIVLGGGISAVGEVLTRPLKKRFLKLLFGGSLYAPVKIITAELENNAGIYGAAKLFDMKK